MDAIICLILILIIIGIILLSKNHIKYKIREGLGSSVSGVAAEEEKEEIKVLPDKDTDGYEIVGSAAPPSFKDAIYDHNLKYAKTVWEELGCDPQSKYAPNIHNKDNLFDSTHGWAREDYKFRVKSLNVEANKAEYNYYDWGKYKYRDEKQTQQELPKEVTTDISANLWDMDKKKIGSNWKKTINRPNLVRYPMGMRKAQTLCYGTDPGDYTLPKIGDKVKIRQKVNYNSPYFAGIVVADKQNAEDSDPVEVLWYQKGTATIDPRTNKIINYFNNDNCNLTNLSTDEDGCTRDLTQTVPRETIIDLNKGVSNSIGWKLYGSNKQGGNGQQDWFGSPDLSLKAYKNANNKTLDEIEKNGFAWKNRYLKDTKKKIPDKLKNYDNDAKLKTILDDGSIDPKAVFKIKECQENSACEDLRCSTIVEKIKKQYPLTKVCKVEHKNTYEETNGQYCNSGRNKGATFTYFSEPPLCSFQDYGGTRDNSNEPKNFCNAHCNDCKDISKMSGNWKTSYFAEVWSKPGCKGQKAIVRGKDGRRRARDLFPDGSNKIKSFKLYGKHCTAMMSDSGGVSDMKPYITYRNSQVFSELKIKSAMFGKDYGKDDYEYIEICKFHTFKGKNKPIIQIKNNDSKSSFFEDVPIPKIKAKYLSITGLIYGDQNWGNIHNCNIRAYHEGGGSSEFGSIPMNEDDGQTPHSTREGSKYMRSPNDDYGISLITYDIHQSVISTLKSMISSNFSCNWAVAIFSFGIINCGVQKKQWEEDKKENEKEYNKMLEEGRSLIKLRTNKDANKLFSIRGDKKVNKLRLYPSSIGSGHESTYLGFSNIYVYESLK